MLLRFFNSTVKAKVDRGLKILIEPIQECLAGVFVSLLCRVGLIIGGRLLSVVMKSLLLLQGINLTSADTCIIYDSDWNPQQDLQVRLQLTLSGAPSACWWQHLSRL